MDTATSAGSDEKTSPMEWALATLLGKSATQEKSKPSGALGINAERFNSFVARLTSNSIEGRKGLVCEPQKMQEFLKAEVVSQAHKYFHPAPAMSARGDRRRILSNEFESGSSGRGAPLSHLCWFARVRRESLAKGAGEYACRESK